MHKAKANTKRFLIQNFEIKKYPKADAIWVFYV
jgi:hypothetical protein